MATCDICGSPIWGKRSLDTGRGSGCRRKYGTPRSGQPNHRTHSQSRIEDPDDYASEERLVEWGRPPLPTVVKAVVVGASCAGVPGACPAILFASRADEVVGLARRVLRTLESPNSAEHRVAGASFLLSRAIVESVVEGAVGNAVSPALSTANEIIANELARAAPEARPFARAVVAGTISGLGRGGADGLISWLVGDP